MKALFPLSSLLLLFFAARFGYANGDPVAYRSAVIRASNPEPMTVAEVQLISEQLTIEPLAEYTRVTARYLLRNASDRDFERIDYGFPVDWIGEAEGFRYIGADRYTESVRGSGWRDDCIRNVAFFRNGSALPCAASEAAVIREAASAVCRDDLPPEDDVLTDDELVAKYGEEVCDTTPAESRRWFYTYFPIGRGETVELEVTYALGHSISVPLYSLEDLFACYNPWEEAFRYDFTPSAHWGDGTVGDFTVEVVLPHRAISDRGDSHGDDYCLWEGLPLQRRGDRLCYHATNFRLAEAEPLRLHWQRFDGNGIYPLPVSGLLNRRIDPSQYEIDVRTKPDYPAALLSDLNPGTACVIESPMLVVRFREPTEVRGVLLFNGYMKSAQTYERNSRIRRMTCRVTLACGEVRTVETAWKSGVYTCADVVPDDFSFERLFAYAEKIGAMEPTHGLFDTDEWDPEAERFIPAKVREISFGIDELVPGSKYADLCVSEIMFFGTGR